MRRSFKTAIIILILLFAFSFAAYAGNTARADIPVKVEGGGTAVITSEVNCPAPKADRLELKKGETGHFIIDFSRPGEYAYNITVINSNDSFIYTPEYYSVHISVLVGDDGSMYTVTTLRKENSYAKSDIADFRRTEKTTGAPPTTTSTDSTPHQPRTGDDTNLEKYVVASIAASAGLFVVSLLYAYDTKRLLRGY
ncbi:MAG: hypothetical protein IJU45_05195 [Clostridia bacterium]|nr:hypothetical protein [Clostridia bacterium]